MSFEQVLGYLNYAATQGAIFIYLLVFISCIIENIFPPYPGDLIVLSGAFLAGRGSVGYIPLLAVSVAGGMIGALLLYYFGKYKGRSFFEKYDKYYLKMENLHRIENWFKRWGALLLLFSRFVAGARSAIAVTAGIADVPVKRMAGLTLISFILWNGLLIGGMHLVKSNWVKLVDIIKSYNTALVIASALLLLLWLVIIYRRSLVKK
jgi:membrane protein DedA with SNARE-associated domain